jgi:hypothetical protein
VSRAARTVVLAVAGVLVLGRLASDAWIVDPRPPVGERPQPPPGPAPPFALVVLDGVRADAALPGPSSAMPHFASLCEEGAFGIARTGEPTLTLGCVRALLTGIEPDPYVTFVNFSAPPVDGHLLDFLLDRGATGAHAGDAAIVQLAGRRLERDRVLAFPDRGPRDQGETDDLATAFAKEQVARGCDLLTMHLVRPDHAGHRHGAAGAEYRAACRRTDEQVAEVVGAFRARHPGATVLVAADHGVTLRGNHGGGQDEARDAPFVLVGPRIARAPAVRVPQTSLPGTVCAAMGLPQPPLARTPPALALTRLSPQERADALDAHLVARIAAARALGRLDAARVAEARRGLATRESDPAAREAAFAAVLAGLDADLPRGLGALAAAALLALATLWVAGLASPAAPAGLGGAASVVLAVAAVLALPSAAAGALLAAACVPLVLPRPGLRVAAVAAVGACVLVTLAAAGLAVQGAFDGGGDGSSVLRLAVAAAAASGLAWVVGRRLRGPFGAVAPAVLLAGGGVLVGLPLTLRPFLDPLSASPSLGRDLFAVAGTAAATLLALRAPRRPGDRVVRVLAVVVAALVLLGGRAIEYAGGEGFALARASRGLLPAVAGAAVAAALAADALRRLRPATVLAAASAAGAFALGNDAQGVPFVATGVLAAAAFAAAFREPSADARFAARCLAAAALGRLLSPSDASAALFTTFVAGCRLAGTLSAPRTPAGAAGLAIALVAVRAAVFHALGHAEDGSTVDVREGFALWGETSAATPASGGGPSVEVVLAILVLTVRFALPWVAMFAACARSFEAAGRREGTARLLGDLGVAYAARAAAIVLVLSVWWRSAWWVKAADPVFQYAGAEVLLASLAFLLASRIGSGTAPAPAPRAPEPASQKETLTCPTS